MIQQTIIDYIISALTTSDYTVMEGWDQTQVVDNRGVISVNCTDVIALNHGDTTKDNEVKITINAMTQIINDKDKSTINDMLQHILSAIDDDNNDVDNVAGIIVNNYNINSDGQRNIATINITYYTCEN